VNIYEVKVCKFISEERCGNVYRLNRSDFVTHRCIIDFVRLLATDIFTGEQFCMLQRNAAGQILKSETVELNKNYAAYFTQLNLQELSTLELWKIKLACLKMNLLGKISIKSHGEQKQNIMKR